MRDTTNGAPQALQNSRHIKLCSSLGSNYARFGHHARKPRCATSGRNGANPPRFGPVYCGMVKVTSDECCNVPDVPVTVTVTARELGVADDELAD